MRNIIFDLGAVIIDIDYNLTADAFRRLGLLHFDEIYSKAKQDHLFDRFEKGDMSDEEFRETVRKHIPHSVSDEQIDSAWNAMLKEVPEETFGLLEEIGKQKRIFLLSNTNRIHVRAFSKIIERQYGFARFESLFEKAYYSCDIGMRKPDAEIFEFVLLQHGLKANETLFIDDSPQHVEGARNCGIFAFHLRPEHRLGDAVGKLQQD
jgi:HAD superfamily hydrolase (TIGR01509 family)